LGSGGTPATRLAARRSANALFVPSLCRQALRQSPLSFGQRDPVSDGLIEGFAQVEYQADTAHELVAVLLPRRFT
jgi:hypothetical protein